MLAKSLVQIIVGNRLPGEGLSENLVGLQAAPSLCMTGIFGFMMGVSKAIAICFRRQRISNMKTSSVVADQCQTAWDDDPLAHPSIAAMTAREIADLPMWPCGTARAEALPNQSNCPEVGGSRCPVH